MRQRKRESKRGRERYKEESRHRYRQDRETEREVCLSVAIIKKNPQGVVFNMQILYSTLV